MAGLIVVGVDGSRDSRRALQWAFEEALVHDAELLLVHTWEYPVSHEDLPPDIEQTHAGILAREAARVINKGVRVRTELVEKRTVPALVGLAADANLLVVGCRGHNRMLRTILGSVSSGCVHQASCPVVVVRADEPAPIEKPPEADQGARTDGGRKRPAQQPAMAGRGMSAGHTEVV